MRAGSNDRPRRYGRLQWRITWWEILICVGILIVVDIAAITNLGTATNNTFTNVPSKAPGEAGKSLALASATTVQPGPLTAQEAADKDIRKLLDDQQQAWNRSDLNGFMAGYWKSEKLTFYSGKDKTTGWQATLDRYRKRYQAEGREMGKLSFSELEVTLLGPDHALVRGRWQVISSKEKPSGLFTLLAKKLPEGWRIVHDHTSGG